MTDLSHPSRQVASGEMEVACNDSPAAGGRCLSGDRPVQRMKILSTGCSRAHVREVVYETHRRLAAAARVPAHLIPLTFNFSRSELEMCATRQVSTRP